MIQKQETRRLIIIGRQKICSICQTSNDLDSIYFKQCVVKLEWAEGKKISPKIKKLERMMEE